MPLIPETWLDSQVVNSSVSGQQSQPDIAQLSNGNILVTWTSAHATGDGAPAGTEVFGQLYDPMGVPIGSEFRINQTSTSGNERDSDIVTLATGGFIVIYHDDDIDGLGGSDLRLEEFDAAGLPVSELPLIISDTTAPAFSNYANPRGAASSDTSVMIAYDKITSATTTGVFCKIYDPTTNTYGSEIALMVGDQTNNADVAVLSNGNYVIAAQRDSADSAISYRIMTAAGINVLGNTNVTDTNTDGFDDSDVSVTALAGGGFVLVWTQLSTNSDIMFRTYDSAGSQTNSGSIDGGSTTNNNKEAVVVTLADGTFVVIYDNDETGVQTASHRSATGALLGSFDLAAGSYGISAVSLDDGRFAVTYMLESGDDIQMEILDTRDSANADPVYTPTGFQIGTVGDDLISAIAATVHGHSGNDTITEASAGVTIFGDSGDDRIIVASAIDSEGFFGGIGNDMIDWSTSSQANGVYDLLAGTAKIGAVVEQMQGFEGFLGTQQNDTILGTAGRNTLAGSGGNDTINGRAGADDMTGGAGNDLFIVDNLGDKVRELAGGGTADRVVSLVTYVLAAGQQIERMTTDAVAGMNAINLTGNALAQTISGNAGINVLSAGAAGAADRLIGYGGNDIYRVFNTGDVIVEGPGGGTADRVITTVSFTLAADDNIEFLNTSSGAGLTVINLVGNALSQVIVGNAAGNLISGGSAGGADTLNGQGGNDIYRVYNAGDIIIESLGNGNSDRVNAATSFNLAVDDNIEIMSTISSAATTAINLRGNGLSQILFGNAGANRLNGGGGSDTLIGGLGNDVFIFQAALGPLNVDRINDYAVSSDQIEIDNAAFVGLALGTLGLGAFTANTTGSATLGTHRIIYETDTGFLWFDADGSGTTSAKVQFADLAGGLAILASEFSII